ncbi:hypothetical protein P154DRAFT_618864 [Amniculicola lignicola CBS 123094]|uniref:DUF6594 domain-containing protein n=1 Tax=Amniculicola lignicola CBS 123094 TaxID=1392246 RepID=A0A6A5WMY4_9PLEO|nr:hypothetical protein P154DRAFT_618864 [Amniculicola lignicola CBS 123094]
MPTLNHTNNDIEKSAERTKQYLEGFPSLSSLLCSDSDLQVYRRFNRLASRNLLYLQAEILDIEARLEEHDAEDVEIANSENDATESMEVKLNARCWEVFKEKAKSGDRKAQERMDLIRELRERMAEYQDALIRQSALMNLETPGPRVRGAITGWFELKKPLVGRSRNMFSDAAQYDTVALRTPPDQDRLTRFLQNSLGYFFRHRKTKKEYPLDWDGMYYFPETTIRHIVSFTSVFIAAALLVGAITSLYFVQKPSSMIGLLAAFTTLFAGSIGLLTNARKVDIYAATAAYAAVLVVFVGNLGMSPGG